MSQRLERGLFKIVSTHIILLSLFILLFSYIFQNQGSLDALIEADMVEDPLSIEDPLVQFYIAHLSKIIWSLITVPVLILLLVMLYNRLPDKKPTPSTTPLLEDKTLCEEVVVSTNNSITIMW